LFLLFVQVESKLGREPSFANFCRAACLDPQSARDILTNGVPKEQRSIVYTLDFYHRLTSLVSWWWQSHPHPPDQPQPVVYTWLSPTMQAWPEAMLPDGIPFFPGGKDVFARSLDMSRSRYAVKF
jgi:hypothetical protein